MATSRIDDKLEECTLIECELVDWEMAREIVVIDPVIVTKV
jgi:hypothetical protein